LAAEHRQNLILQRRTSENTAKIAESMPLPKVQPMGVSVLKACDSAMTFELQR
jgi:hypothetical protein